LAEASEPDGLAVPLLEARGLVKKYGNVQALDGASFSAYPGEVVALIGDNGAGKSTLVKTLSGVIRPDSGQILIEGSPASAPRTRASRASPRK
jgi:simple sugar transport system ATP-binding protein